jgi:hypothetical protein
LLPCALVVKLELPFVEEWGGRSCTRRELSAGNISGGSAPGGREEGIEFPFGVV